MNKKTWSSILSFMLVFSLVTSAFAAPERVVPGGLEKLIDNSTDKNVRVIVELEKDPITKSVLKTNMDHKDLNTTTYNRLNKAIVSQQNSVKKAIKKDGIDLQYHQEFTNVINGFSATVSLKEAQRIEKLPNVKSVSQVIEYKRPSPLMTSSKDIIHTLETWDLKYKGQGIVVSIIDTGLDWGHMDMKLSNPNMSKLSKKDVALKGLQGQYFTEKVPYGYNYKDNNSNVLDISPSASSHGSHVAGIVGANGKLKGVAPEVQLLAMKIFGNDPLEAQTSSDILLKAIDDSVKMGADVINMSLGNGPEYVAQEDPVKLAIENAVNIGIVCSIAAGNDSHIGAGYAYPMISNPDYGLVGVPSVVEDSISVASIENTNSRVDILNYHGGTIPYILTGKNDPSKIFKGQEVEYIDAGDGSIEFLSELKGKIALIIRGGNVYTFEEKIQNAIEAGARGVIIRNHEAGGDDKMEMSISTDIKIPTLFIGYNDGLRLIDSIREGENTVSFKGEKNTIINPDAGKLSNFTSWGPTQNLELKPELTAPGGLIYSIKQGNEYVTYSGTSMATPHVSGGSALVLQRVEEDFNLSGREKSQMIKNLLMSTAKPVEERFGFTSPRRQGAGLMNLFAATTTDAIVVEGTSGISKVELKEIGNKSEFTLKLKNFGEKQLKYKIDSVIQIDLVQDGENLTEPQELLNTDLVYKDMGGKVIKSITVPGKGEVDFKVEIDLKDAIDWANEEPLKDLFQNGTFIDGYIFLKEESDNQPDLSIPYMGFYGEWDKAPIIDPSIYEEESFYGATGLATQGEEDFIYLGLPFEDETPNADNIAFSPNGDENHDLLLPILSFLRNAKEVKVSILDKNGAIVRNLSKDHGIVKNYNDGGEEYHFQSYYSWIWDGKTYGRVKEGKYIYQIQSKIDYPGARWQTLEFPVKVDIRAPEIKSVNLDKENLKLTVDAKDNMTDIYKYQVLSKGEVLIETGKNIIDLSNLDQLPYDITVKVYDYALNMAESKLIKLSDDKDTPYIMIASPDSSQKLNTNLIEVKGSIVNFSNLKEFSINAKDVDFKYNIESGKYDFQYELNLKNGVHDIVFKAKDSESNEIEYQRRIFVDSQAPQVEILSYPPRIVAKDTKTVKAKIRIKENAEELRVLVYGNEVFKNRVNWDYIDKFKGIEKEIVVDIPLKHGNNDIKIILEDGFENITEETIGNVYKKVY